MEYKFLVETALLGQGLMDCGNRQLAEIWHKFLPADLRVLVWLWQGKIVLGNIEEFLQIRHTENMGRYNMYNLAAAQEKKRSGFLTAGGAMKIAADFGKKLVVSCGIGGIQGEEISSDYPALCGLDVVLLATAVKDMFDVQAAFDYLHNRGYTVKGLDCNSANGYLFVGDSVKLDGIVGCPLTDITEDCRLLLNPIPRAERLTDRNILTRALAAGNTARTEGREFHPAVNRALAEFSQGQTSEMQLRSLLTNIKWATEHFC